MNTKELCQEVLGRVDLMQRLLFQLERNVTEVLEAGDDDNENETPELPQAQATGGDTPASEV